MDSRQGQDSEMEDIAYSHDRILARFAGLLEPEKPTGLSPDTALMLDRLDFKLRSWRHNFDDAVALVSTTMEHQSAYSDQLARTTQSLKRIQDYLGVDDAHAILHPLEADAEIKTLVDIETHLRSIVSPSSPIHHDNSLAGCEECSSECDSEFDIAWRPQGHDDPIIMNLLLDMNKTDLTAELLRAAEHGLVNTMEALLSRLTVHDLESMMTKDRRTALHVAILNGHENIAQKILSKAPNLERRLQQPFARDLLLRRPSVKQIDAMDRPCKNAQYEVSRLRVPMSAGAEYPGAHRCLFPADEIKKLFQRDFVLRIFECDCEDCTTDRSSFDGGHLDQWIQCADRVVKCATSLFALLAHLSRPMLIIGILHKTQDDALRSSSILTRKWLETKCWPELFAENKESAKLLLGEFEGLKHNFLMEKIDGTSREYPGEVILPFARTEEVGKAQGNFGIVYKFEIPEYYREFELPEIFKTPYYVSRDSDQQNNAVSVLTELAEGEDVEVRTKRASRYQQETVLAGRKEPHPYQRHTPARAKSFCTDAQSVPPWDRVQHNFSMRRDESPRLFPRPRKQNPLRKASSRKSAVERDARDLPCLEAYGRRPRT